MNKQSVPAFSLARQVKNLRPQLLARLEKVLDTQQFIGGGFIEAFEKQLAAYLNVKYVISCNSGTDALWMALHALQTPSNVPQPAPSRMGQQDKIILTTPFSFIASSSEIASHGGLPVFIDIEPETFNINPVLLEQWLQQNAEMIDGNAVHRATKMPIVGLLPVDLFGQCADYDKLSVIVKKWNLWIVEDCAQALGAEYNGKKAGTLGTIGTFSFYPTKNLGAFGDAGCCVTNDPVLAERLLQLRNHGRKTGYDYISLGINSRMDAFQAAILAEKLPHLDGFNESRRAIADRYNQALSQLPFVKVPRTLVGTHVYHQYCILVEDAAGNSYRGQLEQHLANSGIQTRIFYPKSLPEISFLSPHAELTTACPISDRAVNNILALPMWPELEDGEVDYVIECVKSMNFVPVNKSAERVACL